MPEFRGHRDDQAHVGGSENVEGLLVAALAPLAREFQLLFALEIGRVHRGPNELASRMGGPGHGVLAC